MNIAAMNTALQTQACMDNYPLHAQATGVCITCGSTHVCTSDESVCMHK